MSSVVSEEELNRLGEEFSARSRRGEQPTVDEYVDRFGGRQRDEVREFLESIALLEDLKQDAAASSPSMIALPEHFGRYRIEKALGEGGMGAVYLAHDTQLDRKVALKTPKFGRHFDDHLVDRFYREARAAATLQHPNICPVYDVGELNGIHYISMAYIEGRPLSDYIAAGKLPAVNDTLRIIRRVALALQEAHQVGLIHRDLKPANIMIGRRNEPIVMDFGLARQFDSDDQTPLSTDVGPQLSQQIVQSRLTLDGTVVGSPGYMAPEQLLGDHQRIGPASDVYALGVLMFELLTGRLPFPGTGNLMSIVSAVISDDAPEVTTLRPDVPSAVAEVCRRAFAKRIEDRIPSMESFAVEVTRLLKSTGATGQSTIAKSTSGLTPETVRKREQSELARSLYQEGQFAAAASILEKMTASSDSAGDCELTRWAQKELPRYRAKASAADSALHEPVQFDDIGDSDFLNADWAAASTAGQAPASTRRNRRSGRQPQQKRRPRWHYVAVVLVLLAVLVFAGKRWRQRPADSEKDRRDGEMVALADAGDDGSSQVSTALSASEDENSSGANADGQVATTAVDAESRSDGTSDTSSDGSKAPDAESDRPVRRPPGNWARMTLTDRLWRMDQDENGRLSRQELTAPWMKNFTVLRKIVENFDRFDLPPGDGELDRIEVQRMIRQLPRPGEQRMPPGRRREP